MKQKYKDVVLALSRLEKLRKIADGPRFNMIFGHNFAFFDTNWRGKYKIDHYIYGTNSILDMALDAV